MTPINSQPANLTTGDQINQTLGNTTLQHAPNENSLAKWRCTIKIQCVALRAAEISLEQQVTVSVREADLNELLDAILKDTGCTYRRLGSVVEIVPKR